MMEDYIVYVESVIEQYQSFYSSFDYSTNIFYPTNGLIKGEITFKDKSHLSFLEVKDTNEEPKIKYRYHYMDKDKNLIFRYDNSPYHKEVSTFPHHKHTPNGIKESEEPTIETIMKEIVGSIGRIITSS